MLYIKSLIIGIGILFITTGCSVREKYEKPDAFSGKLDTWNGRLEGAVSNEDLDPQQLSKWWVTLGDDTLNSLVERAVNANLDLRIAKAQLRQARAERKIAESGTMPNVQSNASAFRQRGSANTGMNMETTLYSAGLDAGWEIDVFGGVQAGIDAADSDLQAAKESQRDVLVSVLAEVALNYNDLRTFQRRKSITQQNLDTQKESLDIVITKEQEGSVTRLDVDRARANVETTRSQIPALDQKIIQVQNHLAILLGLPPGAVDNELEKMSVLRPPSVRIAVGVPAQVLRRRPDVRMAERRLAAETYRIGVARAELYPKFTLSGTIGLESLSMANLFSANSLTYGIGPSVKWNVFDGGRIRQKIEIQNAIQEQAMIQYERSILNALEEVENAITAMGQEQLRHDSLEKAFKSAVQAADLSALRYEEGEIDYLSVLDAQRTRLSTEDELVISEGLMTSNLIRLYKALGGGWDPENP